MSNAKLNAYSLWDGMSRKSSEIKGATRDGEEGGVGGPELTWGEDISVGQAWWDVNTKRPLPVR